MDKSAKIYIAGHRGLVGSAIFNKLKSENYNNFLLADKNTLDLRNQQTTQDFFINNKPDYVILAAAKVGGIVANNTYKADFIYDNLMIASNVIRVAKDNGVKKLLNLGSSCIFPKNANIPIKEEYLLTGELEQTNEPYAIAKIAAIKLCRYFNEQYGTDFISLMPNNLYGINDNFNFETSHVLPAILRKILIADAMNNGNIEFLIKDFKAHRIGFGLDAKFDGTVESLKKIYFSLGISENKITLWGSGKVYREFLFNDDLADASVFVMEGFSSKEIGEFINVGYGSDITILELAEIIKSIIGFNGIIEFDKSKPDGTFRKLMDTTRINNLGWKPKIDIETGTKIVVESYRKKIMASI